MDDDGGSLRWGTEQRLEFIEFRVFWEGAVKRGDIVERFGVSTPQASSDFKRYLELTHNSIRYDSSQKRYVATETFKPVFYKPNGERYLVQLKAVADGALSFGETWFGNKPDFDSMPIPARQIDNTVLRHFLNVMRAQQSVEIFYQSMSATRPDAIWRRITPHAFGHDGLRWHVRAFCHIDQAFKDFILSRCRELRREAEGAAKPHEDRHWTTRFEIKLIPNPALTPSQQETIAQDYGMPDGQALVSVRRAMLYYFEKRLRLDIEPAKDRPAEKPVVIANYKEFTKARDMAMT